VDSDVLVTGLTTLGTKGRKDDGACATKTTSQCTTGANGVAAAIANDKASDKHGTCRDITATRCWDGADTPAAVLKVVHSVS
jgi:hypothetical protein